MVSKRAMYERVDTRRAAADRRQSAALFAVVGFLGFVLLPGVITFAMPVTSVRLNVTGSTVDVASRRFLLFVIPYRTERLTDLKAIDREFRTGELVHDTTGRSPDTNQMYRTENTAALKFRGASGTLEVPASPASIEGWSRDLRDFLDAPVPEGYHLLAVANWKFGVIAPAVMMPVTLFYVWWVVSSLCRLILGPVIRLVRPRSTTASV